MSFVKTANTHRKTKDTSSHSTVHISFGVFQVSESFLYAVRLEDQQGWIVHLEVDAFLNKFSADRVEGSPRGANCREVDPRIEAGLCVCGQNCSDVSGAMNLDNNRARTAICRRT